MKKEIHLLLLLILATMSSSLKAQSNYAEPIEELLGKMTLEEKVGQMNQYNGFFEATGPAPSEGDAKMKYEHLKQGLVGSVLNVRGHQEVRKLQELVVNESRLGIPLIFGLDVIHGHKTLAPIPLAEAASWDLEAIEQSARMAATEASAVGINWTFAPMVDISRDARWGRVMEGAGEDPFLGSKVAVARIKGFQGNNLAANNTIAACAKHFAGYGFAEAGRDYNTVDIGTTTLWNVVFPPFIAAVDADVKTVMNAFNVLNGVPATGSEFLQRDILKEKWGFNGFIVSDWASGKEMINHGYASDLEEVARIAAHAGSDMDMESYAYVNHLANLVKAGKVEESVVDDAVRRILQVKFELGLFDDPYRYCSAEREEELLYNTMHMEAALDMAKKSMVLLKNENDMLPINENQEGILVIGELANDKTSPLGSWRIGSDDGTAVSVLEGFDEAGINYTYERGPRVFISEPSFVQEMEVNETDRNGIVEAVEAAREAEVVVMVLGEHGFQSGEARSRTALDFPGLQQDLLEEVYAVNKNIVLVIMSGRPLVLNWADEHIPAILEAWQPGTQSGHAITQVLTGKYNPSGKLPMSFPRSVGQMPLYYNRYNTGRPGPKADVFWSHYIDEKNDALYPFGYGLSYTSFAYGELQVLADDQNITVSCSVENTGDVAGEEVVQVYIRDRVARVTRPVKELKGFEKVSLTPGEKQTVTFTLGEKELGYYNTVGEFVVDPGEFDIMVGGNSRDLLTETVRFEGGMNR